MIAMALACRPRLIIADEPTTALDVMVQAQVLDLLTALVRDLGVGLMMISHDLSVLGTTCDRVAVMYAGRVVEEGPHGQVFDAPKHPYTQGAVRRVPDHRRPGLAVRPRRAARRPALPRRPADRLPVPPALPRRRRPCADRRRRGSSPVGRRSQRACRASWCGDRS